MRNKLHSGFYFLGESLATDAVIRSIKCGAIWDLWRKLFHVTIVLGGGETAAQAQHASHVLSCWVSPPRYKVGNHKKNIFG